jgi:primase-polymerase (primpol)-like protein
VIGFVLTSGDTVAGVNLDDCQYPDTGQPTDMAQDVIDPYTKPVTPVTQGNDVTYRLYL